MEVTLQSAASEVAASEVCEQPEAAPESSNPPIAPASVAVAEDKILVSGKNKEKSRVKCIPFKKNFLFLSSSSHFHDLICCS